MKFQPYTQLNFIFACVIIAIFIYAGFFAFNSNAISCAYLKYTAKPCSACGITRGFYKILHGNFYEAQQYNKNSVAIFSFFAISLIFRLLALVLKINNKKIITADIVFTVVLFFGCFYKLIFY